MGQGKSSILNKLVLQMEGPRDEDVFKSVKSTLSVTSKVEQHEISYGENKVLNLVDTPGFGDASA